MRNGFLAERDFPALTAAASKLAESKIFIDDTPGLSILELRAKARDALGERFDLRAFHDAVLENGGVPLPILEHQIDEYIAAAKEK